MVDREDRADRPARAEAGWSAAPAGGRYPAPIESVYEAGEQLLDRLKYVHDLLANPDISSVRLVLNLERVSIQEAQRSFTYFHMYGFPTDLIVANRVLPAASGVYFEAWREAQARYLPMVEDQFAPVPVRTIPFFDNEMVGLERLSELGHALFGDHDPHQFQYRGRPYSIAREDGGYTLSLELPFTSKEEIALSRSGTSSCCRWVPGAVISCCRGYCSTRRRVARKWKIVY